MFSAFFTVALVRYFSIYHSLLLDYADEETTVIVIRCFCVVLALVGVLFDINFAEKNGMSFRLVGHPDSVE